jgi:hypothetical protein
MGGLGLAGARRHAGGAPGGVAQFHRAQLADKAPALLAGGDGALGGMIEAGRLAIQGGLGLDGRGRVECRRKHVGPVARPADSADSGFPGGQSPLGQRHVAKGTRYGHVSGVG